MCDQSLWVNNKPFVSAMLAVDDIMSMASKQKKGPSVWVQKEDDKKRH